jgi:PAS domain S-box-containing protein
VQHGLDWVQLFIALRGTMQNRMEQGGSGKEIPVRLTQTSHILLKFGRAMVEAADEHKLLQSVCDIFVKDGGFRFAWVGYPVLYPQKTIRPVAQTGDQDEILRNLNLPWAEANPENPASVSISTGQTCFNSDIHILSLPLKSDGQAFGALTLYADDSGQFGQDNIELLEEWSDLFAHAVMSARQTALRADITKAFSREDSLHGILHQCAEALVQHLDAAFARIWTLNKDECVLQLQASAGLYTHLDGGHSRVPVGKLKIGWIAQEKMPHLTNDVIHDPRISDQEWARREGLVAFAGYPLLVEGRVIGVMAMFSRKPLPSSTLEILASIIDPIAQGAERKLAENELRRSETYLRTAQRLSLTGSFGWKVSSGELFWSDETYRIVGLDLMTKPTIKEVLQRVHPEDVVIVKQSLDRAARDGTDLDFEHRFLMPDGSIKHVHVVAHAFKDEKSSLEYFGAVTDVTATKMAEQKIRQDERELRQIIEALPQLIIVLSPEGRTLYANGMMLEYTGCTPEDVLAEDFRERVVHPEDVGRHGGERMQALLRGLPFEIEQRVRRNDGQYRWFLARFNPLLDEQEHVIRWYAVGIDIHDRKQAEEKVQKENIALREEIDKTSMFEEIVGVSPALQTVLSRVSKVAPTDSTVLIHGETGTGKELIARAIHKRSERSSRAFVSVNCAAIPSSLIASELFGHEKGSFTGAVQRRLGRFELADGGTIFLDEIGELPVEIQITLLRVLQERVFERVGGNQSIRADVRVIAATNRDLQAAIIAGTFRIDLFYRLNVVPIAMPPLRDRKEDIALLMEYFIDRYASKAGKKIRSVNKKTLELFQSYTWPGNVRELQNVIERSLIFCDTDTFTVDESWLSPQLGSTPPPSPQLPETLVTHEKKMIEAALAETDGCVSGPLGAAAKLGIPSSTLYRKIKSLKINKHRFKSA